VSGLASEVLLVAASEVMATLVVIAPVFVPAEYYGCVGYYFFFYRPSYNQGTRRALPSTASRVRAHAHV